MVTASRSTLRAGLLGLGSALPLILLACAGRPADDIALTTDPPLSEERLSQRPEDQANRAGEEAASATASIAQREIAGREPLTPTSSDVSDSNVGDRTRVDSLHSGSPSEATVTASDAPAVREVTAPMSVGALRPPEGSLDARNSTTDDKHRVTHMFYSRPADIYSFVTTWADEYFNPCSKASRLREIVFGFTVVSMAFSKL